MPYDAVPAVPLVPLDESVSEERFTLWLTDSAWPQGGVELPAFTEDRISPDQLSRGLPVAFGDRCVVRLRAPVGDPDAGGHLVGPRKQWPQAQLTDAVGSVQVIGTRVTAPSGAERRLLSEGRAASEAGDHARALARLRTAAKRAGDLPLVWRHLAWAAMRADELGTARRALSEAKALYPFDAEAWALQAELALRLGDREGARQAAVRALAGYPHYPGLDELMPLITGRAWAPPPEFTPPVLVELRPRQEAQALLVSRGSDQPLPGPCDEAVVMVADPAAGRGWLAWAACEALGHHSSQAEALFGKSLHDVLSFGREYGCLGTLALAARDPEGGRTADGSLDPQLARIAEVDAAGMLAEYLLYEVFAPRDPTILRVLSPAQHERLLAYLDRFVLGPGAEAR